MRVVTRISVALAMVAASMAMAGAATAKPQPQALALPSPLRFASSLDLECFKTAPYTPPVTFAIQTRHLNPVLGHLPVEANPLGTREQLCVPVAKNNVIPPPEVLAFVRFVDLACYRTQGVNVNQPLRLTHLNRVLSGIPVKSVTITVPTQLCVPVFKNNAVPPPEVRRLVSFIDLKCYVETPQVSLDKALTLSHLNPVLANVPRHNARVTVNRQLCVPVQKNNQAIPADVLNIVRWLDLEKYDLITPALTAPVTLTIRHLNPLLANLPAETVTLTAANQIMLPVAKNGVIPPA